MGGREEDEGLLPETKGVGRKQEQAARRVPSSAKERHSPHQGRVSSPSRSKRAGDIISNTSSDESARFCPSARRTTRLHLRARYPRTPRPRLGPLLHPRQKRVRETRQVQVQVRGRTETEENNSRAPTYPLAGVIATRPATAPEQKPTADHLRSRRQSWG